MGLEAGPEVESEITAPWAAPPRGSAERSPISYGVGMATLGTLGGRGISRRNAGCPPAAVWRVFTC